MCNTNIQIKVKSSMLNASLCDCSDAYIRLRGTITITGAGDNVAEKQADERNEGVIFKNYPPFTKCISEINNTQIDNTKNIDVVMPIYNLIDYSDSCSRTSERLWQY